MGVGPGRSVRMPRISSFYGIVIGMYYDESRHPGRPHFHAAYGGDEASIDIENLTLIAGRLPVQDIGFFRKLRVDREAGTIVWPNEADIAPETLYEHAQRAADHSA